MNIKKRILPVFLAIALVIGVCGCGESKPRYKTTKKIVHVPETTTETRVVGQRIVGWEQVYLPDGSTVDYDEIKDADDISDLPKTDDDKNVNSDNDDNSGNSSSSDDENIKPMTDNFIENGSFNYRIIRPNECTDAISAIAKLTNKEIKAKLNCNTNYKTDALATNANIREFLIGNTNRASSVIAENKLKAKRKLCYYDAIICTVGNDICLFGYEKEALTAVMNYFIETYCKGDTVKVPSSFEYYYRGTKSPNATTIGNTDVADFRIVIPSNPSNLILGSATYLQKYLEIYGGAALDIVYDSAKETQYEIHIGPTSRNITPPENSNDGYRRLNDGKLFYSSKNEDLVYMMIKDFAEGLKVATGSYSLPTGLNETVSYNGLKQSFGNGYNLVWSDEFDSEALDWNVWYKLQEQSTSDKGAMAISDSVKYVFLKNGIANLSCTRIKNKRYVGGALHTGTKEYFMYGYMEAKIKTAPGNSYGSWWLNSERVGIARPEIDMFETFNSPKSLKANLHTWDDPNIKDDASGHIDHSVDADEGDWVINRTYYAPGNEMLADKWRVFAFEWTPNTITMYIDGDPYCIWDISEATTGTRYEAFRGIPCWMKINSMSANDTTLGIGETTTFMVDYVRVYQRNSAQTGYESYFGNSGNPRK